MKRKLRTMCVAGIFTLLAVSNVSYAGNNLTAQRNRDLNNGWSATTIYHNNKDDAGYAMAKAFYTNKLAGVRLATAQGAVETSAEYGDYLAYGLAKFEYFNLAGLCSASVTDWHTREQIWTSKYSYAFGTFQGVEARVKLYDYAQKKGLTGYCKSSKN